MINFKKNHQGSIGVPQEVIGEICQYLPNKDLASLVGTNSYHKEIVPLQRQEVLNMIFFQYLNVLIETLGNFEDGNIKESLKVLKDYENKVKNLPKTTPHHCTIQSAYNASNDHLQKVKNAISIGRFSEENLIKIIEVDKLLSRDMVLPVTENFPPKNILEKLLTGEVLVTHIRLESMKKYIQGELEKSGRALVVFKDLCESISCDLKFSPYLKIINLFHSEFSRVDLFCYILKKKMLNKEFGPLIEVVNSFNKKDCRCKAFIALCKSDTPGKKFGPLLAVAKSFESEYDKHEAFIALCKSDAPGKEFGPLLEIAMSLTIELYKTKALKALCESDVHGKEFGPLLDVVNSCKKEDCKLLAFIALCESDVQGKEFAPLLDVVNSCKNEDYKRQAHDALYNSDAPEQRYAWQRACRFN